MSNVGFSEGRGSISSIRHIGVSEGKRSDSIRKISSALRIEKTSDAVADAAIGTKLKVKMQSINQVLISATQINSTLDVADSNLSSIISILERMKILATQATNTQLTPSDRDKVNLEFLALRDEIDRIAKSAEFNNRHLLSGSTDLKQDRFGYVDPSDPEDVSLRNGFLSADQVFAGGIQSINFDVDSKTRPIRLEYDSDTRKLIMTNINTGISEYVVLDDKNIEDGKTEKVRFHQMLVNVSLNSYFDKTKSFGIKYADKLSQTNKNNNLLNVSYDVVLGDEKFSINPLILKTPLIDVTTGQYMGTDGSLYKLDLETVPDHVDYIDYDTGYILTWDTTDGKYIIKTNALGAKIQIRMESEERIYVPVQNSDGTYQIPSINESFEVTNNMYVDNAGYVYVKGGGDGGVVTGNIRYKSEIGEEIRIETELDTNNSTYIVKNDKLTVNDATSGKDFTFDSAQHDVDKDGNVYQKGTANKVQFDGTTTDVKYNVVDIIIDNAVYQPKGGDITRLDNGNTQLTFADYLANNYSVDVHGYVYKATGEKVRNFEDVKVKMKKILTPAPYVSNIDGKAIDLTSFDVKIKGTYGKAKFYIEAEEGIFESEKEYNLTDNFHNNELDDGLADDRLSQGEHTIVFKRSVYERSKGVNRVDTFSINLEVSANSDISDAHARVGIPDNSTFISLNEMKNTLVTYRDYTDTLDLVFKVGESDEEFDKISVSIESVTSARLGMDGDDFEIKTLERVPEILDKLSGILESVLMRTADIAIMQNRIAKTIDNITSSVKNSQLATSAIFDLDIPSEMVNLSQFELQQSAAIESLSRELKAKQNLLKLF